MSLKRVGLTMRVVENASYRETRDALAQDWIRWNARVMPDVQWLPIPNLGKAAVEFARNWGLEGFIFTGGDSVGETPERDETERRLLDFAMGAGLPVFGVCRGLQIIQRHLGGVLRTCVAGDHVGCRHTVMVTAHGDPPHLREVNSFHQMGVRNGDLAAGLQAFAQTPDGWVEGFMHREASIVAIQWHPERDAEAHPEDASLMRQTLGLTAEPESVRSTVGQDGPLLNPFTFPPCVP